MEELKNLLATSTTLSIMMDIIWSDKKMRGYLGLTAHYINNDQLTSGVLGVPHFKGKGDYVNEQ